MKRVVLWSFVVLGLIISGYAAIRYGWGPTYWQHPLGQCAGNALEVARCKSYNWWSGLGSDLGELTLVGSIVAMCGVLYHHIECQHEECHKLGRFVHGHYKFCHVHHPHVPDDGKINGEQIAAMTEKKAREAGTL